MTCADALEALLEADLTTLEGTGGEPLARHILGCPSCAKRARAILQGEASLARALDAHGHTLDFDQILDAADARTRGTILPLPIRWRSWALSSRGLTLLPLAAAAAVAALVLAREPSLPGPVYSPPSVVPGLEVEAPEGASVAVLETNNPEITVLWLF